MDYLDLIQNVIDRIEDHIGEKMQVPDLAGSVYCSDAHFSRIFHSVVGMPIMDYLRGRRLSLAGHDLVFTKMKIIDTALKFGYETPEAFAKAFKRYHGLTPKECRKTCVYKYQERFFPMVIKMTIMNGGAIMSDLGSPLQQILDDLDQSSKNLYFCFNARHTRYALKALDVFEVCTLKGLYLNAHNELCLAMRDHSIPVVQLEDTILNDETDERKQSILCCGQGEKAFGLLIDGSPALKVLKSTGPIDGNMKPYLIGVGQFGDEQTPIISTHEFFCRIGRHLEKLSDESTPFYIKDFSIAADGLSRLEYAAYEAELLARNTAIEAANGMQHHRGTMVIAHELHRIANELSQIARELRSNHF